MLLNFFLASLMQISTRMYIYNLEKGRKPIPIKSLNYKLCLKYSVLGICFLLFLIGAIYKYNKNSFVRDKMVSMGEPVSQQMLKFEERKYISMASFFQN